MANAIAFSLTLPLLRQIAFESTDYGWWFHKPESMGLGMRQNRFLGDEFKQFGGYQQSKQAFQPKLVNSQDDFQVDGRLPEKADNIGFFESGFATAEDSSSDYALFGNDEAYAAWNTPWGGTEFAENITTAVKKPVVPDYYFIGTEGKDNGMFESLDSVVNPQTGQAANLYVDTRGGGDDVKTGDGCDVIHTGGASERARDVMIFSKGGDDSVFGSNARDWIYLGEGDDKGYGGGGVDRILGLEGEDYLDGGANSDVLYGGKDADTFAIDLSGQTDVIYDFVDLGDKIILRDGQSSAVNAGDWFIQTGQSTDPSAMQALNWNNGIDCFNIVSASTGKVACVGSQGIPQGTELFLKATGNALEIVDEASATLSFQIWTSQLTQVI